VEMLNIFSSKNLNGASNSQDDILKWSNQIGLISSELEEKEMQWLELSEKE
jgi:hypothetical protein